MRFIELNSLTCFHFGGWYARNITVKGVGKTCFVDGELVVEGGNVV